MEKLLTKYLTNKARFLRIGFIASVGFPLILASKAFGQFPAPAVAAEPGAPAPTAEVERVVVTGSSFPTAGETGPNPVDTNRPMEVGTVCLPRPTHRRES